MLVSNLSKVTRAERVSLPGFEPGTFGLRSRCFDHYTNAPHNGVIAESAVPRDRVVDVEILADDQLRATAIESRPSGNRKRRVDCIEQLPSDIPPRTMNAA